MGENAYENTRTFKRNTGSIGAAAVFPFFFHVPSYSAQKLSLYFSSPFLAKPSNRTSKT